MQTIFHCIRSVVTVDIILAGRKAEHAESLTVLPGLAGF